MAQELGGDGSNKEKGNLIKKESIINISGDTVMKQDIWRTAELLEIKKHGSKIKTHMQGEVRWKESWSGRDYGVNYG